MIEDTVQPRGALGVSRSAPIRLLLIAPHALVRAGLRLLLERQAGLQVVGEAAHRAEALASTRQAAPELILLDLDPGDASGLDVIPELLTTVPTARVLVLTGLRDPAVHRQAVRLGAMGLVHKDQAAEVLLQAIAKIHQGEVWFDRALIASVLGEMTQGNGGPPADPEMAKIATLTAREREVVALVGDGLKNQQIGHRLCISEATVRHHLTSIFAKLSLVDRLKLVIYAYRHGLAQFPS